MFETIKPNRISETIVMQIRAAILNGDLQIGERLPPEKDLSDQFGVSKSTLREAFRVLEAHGFIEIRQGMAGGAFVKEVDFQTTKNSLINYFSLKNPDIWEYREVWKRIEPEILKRCVKTITDDDIGELEQNLKIMKDTLRDERTLNDLDRAFHKKLVDIADNGILSLVAETVQTIQISGKSIFYSDEAFLKIVCKGHQGVVDALRIRDPEKACVRMLQHIQDVEAWTPACKGCPWPD